MKKHSISFLILICLLVFTACQKDDPVLKNDGTIVFQGNSYNLTEARLLRQYNHLQLVLYPSTMSITELGISGYGSMLKIDFNCDSTHLKQGTYNVNTSENFYTITAGSSVFITIPESAGDTVSIPITGGQCSVAAGELGNDYNIAFVTNAGDSINGIFKGKYVYNNDTDGKKVGYVTIGTTNFDLQRGDLIPWYHVFSETLFYYEFYFYSTTIRYTDAGKISRGLMLVIGLHSTNETVPPDGTYPITLMYQESTALFGYKTSTYDWGCYWYNYLTSTASEKAFIRDGEVVLQHIDNRYHFTFNFKDQLGNTIQGDYDSDFNIINISR
ncbi:MAG: hypothetical protein PHH23_05050 [Paludibacteraceae bacterium]|nr:hypothetical protein [Paludibacteraceae bacterium]